MPLSDNDVRDLLGEYARIGPAPTKEPVADRVQDLRRGRRLVRRPPSRVALVEQDGLVYWEWGKGKARLAPTGTGRRAARRGAPPRKGIYSESLAPLGSNQIGQMLADFDKKRNAAIEFPKGWNLRQWHAGKEAWAQPAAGSADQKKSVLVIVHGTASSCQHISDELRHTDGGRRLLADAARQYGAVLAFDHPTIAVSPILNALDLAQALQPYAGCDVDIICHSRGGLVSSWWMHMADRAPRKKRCVFVGSPLLGTNMANSAKLRQSLHALASYGRVFGDVIPAADGFLALPLTIIRVVSSVVDFTAKVPLLDAALAMIPGLNAQSRTDNNAELLRLKQLTSPGSGTHTHFYIGANFNSSKPGWEMWKYVTDSPKLRVTDAAVDMLVFPGKNDLVVDMDAMTDKVGDQSFNFDGEGMEVHHTNYFQQEKTVELIRSWLGVPGASRPEGTERTT